MRNPIILGAVLAAALAAPAAADLQIAANINGTSIACVDNNIACDTNPALGTLQIADQTVAGVQFLGSAQTQVVGAVNSLNTTSFQFINNNPGTVALQLAVSGTSFQGPVETFSASGSGTWQSAGTSDIRLTFYADPANAQGAANPTDLPGSLLADSGLLVAVGITDSIAFNASGAFVDPDLYSMALGTHVNLIAGGSLVGRSQTLVTEQKAKVGEPGSLALLGAGLLGLGFVMNRRKHLPAFSA